MRVKSGFRYVYPDRCHSPIIVTTSLRAPP